MQWSWGNDVSGGAKYRACVRLGSLTGALDHRLQHPVALVPSPPERQRLVLIEELLQVGGCGGMGGAEVEGAEAGVRLCRTGTSERVGRQVVRGCKSAKGASSQVSPCSKTMGFLSATACLISIWQ